LTFFNKIEYNKGRLDATGSIRIAKHLILTHFLSGERLPQDSVQHKEKLSKFFKQFDLDGDGVCVAL